MNMQFILFTSELCVYSHVKLPTPLSFLNILILTFVVSEVSSEKASKIIFFYLYHA